MKLWYVLLLMSITTNVFSITLDPYLLQHAIYGKSAVITIDVCSTPQNGIVGTPGEFKSGNTMNMQTEVRFNDGNGGWKRFKVLADSVHFQSINSPNAFNVVAGDTVRETNVYPVIPVMPVFNESYTGTINANINNHTYSPGQYNKLATADGATIYLTAGIYHFKSVLLESNSKVKILPDNNGNYSSEIYVEGSFKMKTQSYFKPNTSAGDGEIALIATGHHTQFSVISPSYITASVIAPDIKVVFNSGSVLIGQLFADTVSLNNFDGGVGLDYVPLNQVKIIPQTQSFLETDGDTVIVVGLKNDVPDSNGTIKWKFISGTADINTDLTSAYPKSGILTYIQGTNVSTEDIKLYIYDDNLTEPDETFILELYDASSNINLPTDPYHITITILENDQNTHPPIVRSDTLFCDENGNVISTPNIYDPD